MEEAKKVLEQFKQRASGSIDADSLVDISKVEIDTDKPVAERIKSFLAQIGNPYMFKVDDIVVRVSFKPNAPTLQECLEKVFTV